MDSTTPSLGQRLLAAVIPARFKDLNALHLASRIAYSTIHKWRAAAQTMTAEDLVARSRCPAWLTLATRNFLLRWESHASPVSCKRYSEST